MSQETHSLDAEQAHLQKVLTHLHDAIEETTGRLASYSEQYSDAKRYNADYRHEIDPQEIFQNELALHDIALTGSLAEQQLIRLTALLDKPYFSSIEFWEDGESAPERFYLGRFTFSHDQQIYIFDWRSPVAGMFYDCEPGRAGYDAPACRIEGQLLSKRQYQIAGGRIVDFFESASGIRDEILQKELHRATDKRMKTIISTLQKQQNTIIREDLFKTLIIQGAAGSGKTSVALHRIAYLLYRHQSTLSARNILILSPGRVFSDYISGVLPELGEDPVYQMGAPDIAAAQLEGIVSFLPPDSPSEAGPQGISPRFQYSADIVPLLDRFLAESLQTVFKPTDYTFGRFRADALWIKARFDSYTRYPVVRRLAETANDILQKFISENTYAQPLPTERTILKSLRAMLTVKDSLTLYRAFYKSVKRECDFSQPDTNTLEWADVYPFLYVHAHYTGLRPGTHIKHLVIDEMQDYPPVFYAVINRIFPCSKTILGDFGQSLNAHITTGIEGVSALYPQAHLVQMRKSYRSSYEIISFARQIANADMIEPVARHGTPVHVLEAETAQAEIDLLIKLLLRFAQSQYHTLGILVKTQAQANALYDALRSAHAVHCITPDSRRFHAGISVCPVALAKGLEFDCVIVSGVCDVHYHTANDRRELFVACTRALHELTLIYQGNPSPLIP